MPSSLQAGGVGVGVGGGVGVGVAATVGDVVMVCRCWARVYS